jgi:AmmeMemoRadiSam system protein A
MQCLAESDRQRLLELARKAVTEAVSHRKLPETIPEDGIFGTRRGVFVTLHVRGKLRGCIGTTEAHEALGDAVVRCAASAALHDPRFPQMKAEELGDLEVEISVLSPLMPIEPEDIEIGKHGLVISAVGHKGLLLPQVAVEHHLSREEFLGETCWKAGLPRDAWRDVGVVIQGFTCDVFGDEKSGVKQTSS